MKTILIFILTLSVISGCNDNLNKKIIVQNVTEVDSSYITTPVNIKYYSFDGYMHQISHNSSEFDDRTNYFETYKKHLNYIYYNINDKEVLSNYKDIVKQSENIIKIENNIINRIVKIKENALIFGNHYDGYARLTINDDIIYQGYEIINYLNNYY